MAKNTPINHEILKEGWDYDQLLQRKNSVLHILIGQGGFGEADETVRPVVKCEDQRFGLSQQTASPETGIWEMVNAGTDFRRHENTNERQWQLYNHNILKPLTTEPTIVSKRAIGIMDASTPRKLLHALLWKKK